MIKFEIVFLTVKEVNERDSTELLSKDSEYQPRHAHWHDDRGRLKLLHIRRGLTSLLICL